MSGDKLKSLSRNIQVAYLVCSLDEGSTFPADEQMIVKRFQSGDKNEAMNWITDNQHNHRALTILEIYV